MSGRAAAADGVLGHCRRTGMKKIAGYRRPSQGRPGTPREGRALMKQAGMATKRASSLKVQGQHAQHRDLPRSAVIMIRQD